MRAPLNAKVSHMLIKLCEFKLLALTPQPGIKAMFTLVINSVDKMQQQKD